MSFKFNDRRGNNNLSRWKKNAIEDRTETLVPNQLPKNCDVCWGSHMCDWEYGHEGAHICGVFDPEGICSQYQNGQARFMEYDVQGDEVKPIGFSPWMPMSSYTASAPMVERVTHE